MGTQDSRRDLRSTLGALTPPAPVVGGPTRGTQNSGLFDLDAMSAAELNRAIQRARAPVPSVWEVAPEDVEIAVVSAVAPKRASARWIGRVRVGVTWIATTTLGFVLAASVPAHAHRLAPVLAPVAAVAAAAPVPPAPLLAPVDPAPAVVAGLPAALPVLSLHDLPSATGTSDTPAHKQATGGSSVPRASASREGTAKAPRPAARNRSATQQATKPTDTPTRAPAKTGAGPTSLDDLIRQTVESESKAGRRK